MNRDFCSRIPMFETVEPNDSTLEIKRHYNVAGLINANVVHIPYLSGKLLQRVSVITPLGTQIVLEIWNSSKKYQPIFTKRWQNLQFIFARNCAYHGMLDLGCSERKVHVFRMSQFAAEKSRYIWLSSDRQTFWDTPVSETDWRDIRDQAEIEVICFFPFFLIFFIF